MTKTPHYQPYYHWNQEKKNQKFKYSVENIVEINIWARESPLGGAQSALMERVALSSMIDPRLILVMDNVIVVIS